MNQKRINNVQKAEVFAHEIAKTMRTRKEKDEAVAHQMHVRFLARQNKKSSTLQKAHVIALDMNAKRTANIQKAEAQARVTNNKIIAGEKRKSDATNKFASATQKAVQKAILSWKSFERVLLVHVIRRAFHQLIQVLRQSITQIQDFHTAITEIRTISQTMPGSVNAWADSLIRVSNAWGINLIDAANARYQILSNQIAKGVAQTERFSEATFAFAKVTKSTAEQSVNVLTASMNAYGMQIEDTTRVASILFKLVEFGRVRISEISESFGRASVPAAQLGISLEELAAVIANITIKGVKASESMTLIRGIVMKLNKPTEEMKDLFSRLGVTSGEALIQIHGLAGALKILFNETKGSSSDIANLFGRIRPTMGISALLSDLEGFQEVLDEFGDKAVLDYMTALNDQFKTSGEKVKKAFNAIKNFIQIGVGSKAAKTLIYFTDIFKTTSKNIDGTTREILGLTNAVRLAIEWGSALGAVLLANIAIHKLATISLGRSIIAFKRFVFQLQMTRAASGAVAAASMGMAAAFNVVAAAAASAIPILVATFAVVGIVKYISHLQRLKEEQRDLNDELREQSKIQRTVNELKKKTEGSESGRFREELKTSAGNISTGLKDPRIVELGKSVEDADKVMKALETKQKTALKDFENHAKTVVTTLSKMYSLLSARIKKASDEIKQSQLEAFKFAQSIEDKIFGVRQRARDPEKQLLNLRARQAKLLKELNAAEGIDKQRGALSRYVDAVLATESAWRSLSETQAKNAAKEEDADNKREDRVRKALTGGKRKTTVLDAMQGPRQKTNKDVQQSVQDEIARATEAALEKAKKIGANLEAEYELSQQKIIDSGNKAIERLEAMRLKILKDGEKIGGAVATVIAAAFDGISFEKVDVSIDAAITKFKELSTKLEDAGPDMETARNAFKIIDDETNTTRKNLEGWATSLKSSKDALESIIDLMRTQKEVAKSVRDTASEGMTLREDAASTLRRQFSTAFDKPFFRSNASGAMKADSAEFKTITDPAATSEEIAEAVKAIKAQFQKELDLDKKMLKKGRRNPTNVIQQEVIDVVEGAFKVLGLGIKKQITSEEQQQEVDDITSKIVDLKTKTAAAGKALIDAAKASKDPFLDLSGILQGVIDKMNKISENVGVTDKALRDVVTKDPDNVSSGGAIYAAAGSMVPRGTDTVPAMLTPGEFVMNKASTQRMMQQLVPMNFGQMSANNTQSGSNVQFGDVNVTVNGGSNNRQTGVEIGNALRRELRRGRTVL